MPTTIPPMMRVVDSDDASLARELFLTAVGPALIREIAGILQPAGISIMPAKGVLLQTLVYKKDAFRAIRDVDVLVREHQFAKAYSELLAAGFVAAHEEPGLWEVALCRPNDVMIVDLHRRLSGRTRSWLTPDQMFDRGTPNTTLFGAPVVIPDAHDLYAHLLLHGAGHWVIEGELHHPEDFEAVPRVLGLEPGALADHLVRTGLVSHAAFLLPLIQAQHGGDFTGRLLSAIRTRIPFSKRTFVAATLQMVAHITNGHLTRRIAGFLLAPSWSAAARDAIARRLRR